MCTALIILCCNSSPGLCDDLDDFAEVLEAAGAAAEQFRGTFVCYAGADQSSEPPGFSLDGLSEQCRGRAWIDSGNLVVEFLDGTATLSPDKSNDQIREVLAVSGGKSYRFDAAGSSVTQFANLRVQTAKDGGDVQSQINNNLIVHLKSITEVAGFPVTSVLASPEAIVTVDAAKGAFSVRARSDGPSPSIYSFELTVTQHNARSQTRLEMGPASSRVVVESAVDATRTGQQIFPRRVVRRTSGSGYGTARREVVLLETMELPRIAHPVTVDFFSQYERDFPVVYGSETETDEFVAGAAPEPAQLLHSTGQPAHSATNYRRILIWVNVVITAGLILLIARSSRNRNAN